MSITAIMSVYNEMDYLPLKIQWCRSNNIDLYVCDNVSNDGSWEYLKKENIPSHQYDTQGMFSETLMQIEIYNTLVKLNPEWVLYMGCDLFFDIPKEYNEYDYVLFDFYSLKNTGENVGTIFAPFSTYKYASHHGKLKFLFKWNKNVIFNADDIITPSLEGGIDKGNIMLNYGDTKSKEHREETKLRRMKAWEKGENHIWGFHYIDGSERKWQWDRQQLIDLSSTHHWNTIKRIENDSYLREL